MNFDLGKSVQGTSSAGKATRIKANQIVDVTFEGAVPETLEKKDGSETFSVLRLKFQDKDGLVFEDTVFEPREGDQVRKENNYGYENPSNLEELQFKLKHLISAVAPDVAKKMDDKKDGVKINSWEDLRQFVAKQTAKGIGTKTQIKLLADKDGNARFPGFVLGITKAGETYPRTNFIGANLSFTAKEQERIEKLATATPTKMPDTKVAEPTLAGTAAGATDIDLDDLDLA